VNKGGADTNETAQENFYSTLTNNYNTDFGQFENLSKGLLDNLQPIVNAGPGQYGFTTAENNALNSAAINNGATAAHNAQVAANQQMVAANGGAADVPTGAEEELQQQGDVAAAQGESTALNNITQAGYAQGAQNYQNALSGEESVLGALNPNSYAGAATSGGNAATGAVNAETQADDGWMNMVGGALGGAGSVFAGAGTKAVGL
jgi:hypothetical protein